MYTGLFTYTDGSELCVHHVEEVEYGLSERVKVKGTDILKHFFPLNRDYSIRSSDGNATASAINLRSIKFVSEEND